MHTTTLTVILRGSAKRSQPSSEATRATNFAPSHAASVLSQTMMTYNRLRPYQGNLEAMLRDGVFEMGDTRDFPRDSLWCEWAYVINLDDGVLEVYKGFNRDKSAQHPRYTGEHTVEVFGDTFYGVRLLAKIPLDDVRNSASLLDLLPDVRKKPNITFLSATNDTPIEVPAVHPGRKTVASVRILLDADTGDAHDLLNLVFRSLSPVYGEQGPILDWSIDGVSAYDVLVEYVEGDSIDGRQQNART